MGKKRILIVDDEVAFTEMVKLNLEATGNYTVKIQNDASKAIHSVLSYHPDLILLDIIMPEAEGPDVVYQIRKNEEIRDTPIIFLTATVTRDEVNAEDGKIGGHKFLAKPSTVGELIDCIERQLSLKL